MKPPYITRLKLSINRCIIWYIVLLGMFARRLPFQKVFEFVVILAAIYVFCLNNKCRRIFSKNLDLTVCLTITVILFILSACLHVDLQIIISNIHSSIKPVLLFLTVLAITSYNMADVSKVLSKSFWLLNIFWLVNLVVLYIQISGTPLLMRQDWLALNPYYPDLCCGLFGFNGTHKLALFACFMLIYNIVYSKILFDHGRIIIVLYTLITEAIMLLLSTQNDNIMLYVLLPMFYGIYWLFDMKWSGRKIGKKAKRILVTVIILAIGIFFLVNTDKFQKEYWPRITWRINRILFFNSSQYTFGGSNERLAIAQYALSQPDGWLFGKGVGTVRWGDAESFGFAHFGLNSLGSFITLGGIWYFILKTFIFARISSLFAYVYKKKDHYILYYIICLIVFVILAASTIPFSDLPTAIWICLIFVALAQLRYFYLGSRNLLLENIRR